MNERAETIELLNELIQVNEDRSEGYIHVSETLEKEHKNIELQAVFSNFAMNSTRYMSMLKDSLRQIGASHASHQISNNAITKEIDHVKEAFQHNDSDRQSILTSCEEGERATLSIFKKVLDKDVFPQEIKELIRSQQETLLKAYQYIKEYRTTLLNSDATKYSNTLAF